MANIPSPWGRRAPTICATNLLLTWALWADERKTFAGCFADRPGKEAAAPARFSHSPGDRRVGHRDGRPGPGDPRSHRISAPATSRRRRRLRPVAPYKWRLPSGRSLLEIPVTTIPIIKTPFHLSYLLYLSRYSGTAMMAYLRTAIASCRLMGVEPSFLLHPLDLLGGDQAPALKAMQPL